MKAGGGDLEDVFRAEVGQGGDEGEDSGHEEDVEGVGDRSRERSNRDRARGGFRTEDAVVGEEFRKEEGKGGEEKGLDSRTWVSRYIEAVFDPQR